MAIAGDIIIKLAADFAEFAKGMDQSVRQLAAFGKQTAETSRNIDGFIAATKNAASLIGSLWVVDKVQAFAKEVNAAGAEIEKTARTLDLSNEALQVYRAAALKAGLDQDALTSALTKFRGVLSGAVAGGKEQIDALNKLGVKILDVNGNVIAQSELFQQAAARLLLMKEGYQRAALEQQLFGASGEAVRKTLLAAASGYDANLEAAKRWGVVMSDDVIKTLAEVDRRSELSNKQITALAARLIAPAEEFFLTKFNAALATTLRLMDQVDKEEGFWAKWEKFFENKPLGANPADLAEARIDAQRKADLKELADLQERVSKGGGDLAVVGGLQRAIDRIDVLITKLKLVDEQIKRMDLERGQADINAADMQRLLGNEGAPGKSSPVGVANPRPTGGGGGGGGRSDDDNIEAQIKRYQALAGAAEKTAQVIENNRTKNIDDLKREVAVSQQVDEIAAKLKAKYDQAAPALKKQLEEEIRLYETRKSAYQEALDAITKATDIEIKYGDGLKAQQKIHEDIVKAQSARIASTQALTRAEKAQTEQAQIAALTARRYDDTIGNLADGFQAAALAYARANDTFAQGQQIFTGLTNAMSEGLDVLLGKSNKTFGQIAADFASMLAKMALQAALSKVFQTIFNSLGTPAANAVPTPAGSITTAPLPPLPTRAGGGDVYAGQPYWVGEYGPERFVPAAAGRIEPMRSASGDGSTVVVNIDMQKTDGAQNPTQALEFGRRIKAAVVDIIANEKRPGGSLYTRKTA